MRFVTALAAMVLAACYTSAIAAAPVHRGRYPRVETTFHLTHITGNPFDADANDVVVSFKLPDGSHIKIPAFFDGGDVWKARYSPSISGVLKAEAVLRNGVIVPATEAKPEPSTFQVSGTSGTGFVRISGLFPYQFELESGAPYYPIGIDVAWRQSETIDVPDVFEHMAEAGMNWSRVWMCHWDGKNLDWPAEPQGEGFLNLKAARRWDAILEAAELRGIKFQMTLQHHGQVSTTTDPNWPENPWNRKNGGFLTRPEEFFTNDHARALTRSKYRYYIARFGYSPAIMAWELFNEVEGTDAAHNKQFAQIAAWHKEMAAYLRAHDPFHHLITTSSDMQMPGLYDAVDYCQPHTYSPDAVAAVEAVDPTAGGKPIFFGEIGPPGNPTSDLPFLSSVLWANLMTENSGMAQYWFWDRFMSQDLRKPYAALTGYVHRSGIDRRRTLKVRSVAVACSEPGSLAFGPGAGWATARQTTFQIAANGTVKGIGAMPAFFQGRSHREMFPELRFEVECVRPAEFRIVPGSISRGGAALKILVDGKPVAEQVYPAGEPSAQVLTPVVAKLNVGKHQIQVVNDGDDWVNISRFVLTPYGSALSARCKASRDYAALWVFRTGAPADVVPISGKIDLADLTPGEWRVTWWNTRTGAVDTVSTEHVGPQCTLTLTTPSVRDSISVWCEKL